jgi:hypothetical protein
MKTNTNKKWHKLPAGELQSIMQSDQEQQPRFQFDNTTYIFFIFMLFFFCCLAIFIFLWGDFQNQIRVCQTTTTTKQKKREL